MSAGASVDVAREGGAVLPVPAAPASTRRWLGFALAIAAAFGFSCKAILAKLAFRAGADASMVLGLRMAFALPVYLGLAWLGFRRAERTGGPGRVLAGRQWLQVVVLGFLGYYLASYLDFLGLARISAGLERLILFLYPSIVVVLSALRQRRAVGRREWQSMLLGYAGIACVFLADGARAPHSVAAWLGVLAVFGSSIVYSLHLVYAEGAVQQLGSLRFTGLAMSFACLFSLTHFALTTPLTALPREAVYLCALMAYFSTVVPTLLLAEAVKRIGSGRTALCGMIGPVTTVGLEALLLGEQASWSDALGTALVIASVVLLTRDKSAHQK